MNELAYEAPVKLVDPIWRAVLLEMLRVLHPTVLADAGLSRVKWIPVSQCTPSEGRLVLVWNEENLTQYMAYVRGGWWMGASRGIEERLSFAPKLWRELPPPPTGDEG